MDEQRKSRTWMLAVSIASVLVLLVALSAAVGSLLARSAADVAPVVLDSAALTAAHAAEDETQEDSKDSGDAGEHKEGSKMSETELEAMRDKLTEEQFNVCFNAATEPPFSGKYWDHHEPGAYHCVACDAPLFSSRHKFDSGTGWPSFYEAVDRGNIETKSDRSHGMVRTEVLCGSCGAHLGHLFPDGPEPTGLRYCINSASLEFREDTEADSAEAEEAEAQQ